MKKYFIAGLLTLTLIGSILAASSKSPMRKTSDGTYIVNTSTICNAKGFNGATPVEVYIKKGKVVKIVALANNETPDFFAKVKNYLLPKYSNVKIGDAKKQTQAAKVDGCTGATYSTKAVQQNIKAALDYYEKNK